MHKDGPRRGEGGGRPRSGSGGVEPAPFQERFESIGAPGGRSGAGGSGGRPRAARALGRGNKSDTQRYHAGACGRRGTEPPPPFPKCLIRRTKEDRRWARTHRARQPGTHASLRPRKARPDRVSPGRTRNGCTLDSPRRRARGGAPSAPVADAGSAVRCVRDVIEPRPVPAAAGGTPSPPPSPAPRAPAVQHRLAEFRAGALPALPADLDAAGRQNALTPPRRRDQRGSGAAHGPGGGRGVRLGSPLPARHRPSPLILEISTGRAALTRAGERAGNGQDQRPLAGPQRSRRRRAPGLCSCRPAAEHAGRPSACPTASDGHPAGDRGRRRRAGGGAGNPVETHRGAAPSLA
ncbi:hypothetical protein HDA36_003822 [Nocardiopsis composta]|uniref:Uncharacterized protein n=1 Tax=Nocardiopsis composta TaxID=157465 RepID=A0A7W8QNK1_9ACTN|nr:hypothetical protein [Nocardiopsis composta]